MLTERELTVLRLKHSGLTQKEIAKKLGISQPAVSCFYKNALRKIRQAQDIMRLVKEIGIAPEES